MWTNISNKPDNAWHFSDNIIFDCKNKHKDWDGVVGIVNCYGLDSPALVKTRFSGLICIKSKAHSAS
jgi:hypothetical protein